MVALHLTQEEEQSSVMVVDRDESEEDKLYNILWLNKIEKYCKNLFSFRSHGSINFSVNKLQLTAEENIIV